MLTFLLYVFKEKMTDLQKTNKKKENKIYSMWCCPWCWCNFLDMDIFIDIVH